jgi:penicillin-binding protein-related factor A (putative recombinase)
MVIKMEIIQMTDSEVQAQKYLRDFYGKDAFIQKIPDFKQTSSINGGLPDYLVISKGDTIWFEVKKLCRNKKSITTNDFTLQQLIKFQKMINSGARIFVIIYRQNGKEKKPRIVVDYKDICKNASEKFNIDCKILEVMCYA